MNPPIPSPADRVRAPSEVDPQAGGRITTAANTAAHVLLEHTLHQIRPQNPPTTEGKITEGKTTEGKTTEGKTTEGKTTEGKTTEGRCCTNKIRDQIPHP
jgi:DNA polymerase-3 subunit gamma/tau